MGVFETGHTHNVLVYEDDMTLHRRKENDRIIVGNTAVFVLDESGERMSVDHASDLDGYVAFKERGDTEGMVKSNAEQATLHFTEV